MISYAADSHTLYGALYHFPAADHAPGSKRKIVDWDSGMPLGEIDEVSHTYNVIGNMNEFGLSIGETTFGGLSQLGEQPGAIMDYGSLIYVTLQRAKTAREAIKTMGQLVGTYGYASSGESFSIADPNEVWVMEMIGKGKGEKGAVWVARKIPEGYICAHANQARIQTFPLNDPDNCIYSPDVVTFAQRKGLYPASAPADQFSFSDTFNPISFDGARFCEVRVWSFFRKFAPGMDNWLEYVKGYNLTVRMPLWVRPSRKLTVLDVMDAMRDHLEGTWFDFRNDAGAEAFGLPYRWRPLTWEYEGKTYLNERSAATQQTGWSFVSQMRNWMPAPLSGIIWFGVDDAAASVYTPFYGSATRIPFSFDEKNGDMMNFSWTSAFWVFNLVSNFAYTRYSIIHPEIAERITQTEKRYITATADMDARALALYRTDPTAAIELVTSYGVTTGDNLTKDWLNFFTYLFTKYMDGNVKTKSPNPNPSVSFPGYPMPWLKRIVAEAGDKYRVPN